MNLIKREKTIMRESKLIITSFVSSTLIALFLFYLLPRLGITNSYHCDPWYYFGWSISPSQLISDLSKPGQYYQIRYPMYGIGWTIRALIPGDAYEALSGQTLARITLFVQIVTVLFVIVYFFLKRKLNKQQVVILLATIINPFTLSQISTSYGQVSFILVLILIILTVVRSEKNFTYDIAIFIVAFLALLANFGNIIVVGPILFFRIFILEKEEYNGLTKRNFRILRNMALAGIALITTHIPIFILYHKQDIQNNFLQFTLSQLNFAVNVFGREDWGSIIFGGKNTLFLNWQEQFLNNSLMVYLVTLLIISAIIIFRRSYSSIIEKKNLLYTFTAIALIAISAEILKIGNSISFGHDGVILIPAIALFFLSFKYKKMAESNQWVLLSIISINLILIINLIIYQLSIKTIYQSSLLPGNLFHLGIPILFSLVFIVYILIRKNKIINIFSVIILSTQFSIGDYGLAFFENLDVFNPNQTSQLMGKQYNVAKKSVQFVENYLPVSGAKSLVVYQDPTSTELFFMRPSVRVHQQCNSYEINIGELLKPNSPLDKYDIITTTKEIYIKLINSNINIDLISPKHDIYLDEEYVIIIQNKYLNG
jgi:hypothetical protein